MTITIVKGLVGKPVEQLQSSQSQTPQAQQNAAQAAQNAASVQSLGSDAVVMNLRSSRAGERAEPINTYSKARKTSDEVAEKIRANGNNEGLDAHQGLSSAHLKSTAA